MAIRMKRLKTKKERAVECKVSSGTKSRCTLPNVFFMAGGLKAPSAVGTGRKERRSFEVDKLDFVRLPSLSFLRCSNLQVLLTGLLFFAPLSRSTIRFRKPLYS